MNSSASPGSPLTTWLRGLTGQSLAGVLTVRPDTMAAPEPRSLNELADRLQRPASVLLALRRLPLPCLQAAEALAALGHRTPRDGLEVLLEPAGEAGYAGATVTGTTTTGDTASGGAAGAPAPDTALNTARGTALDSVLTELAAHALVWPDAEGLLRMAAPLRHRWETPLGLGPGLEELFGHCSSEDLRRMATAVGLRAGSRKQQRADALLEHHRDPGKVLALVREAPPAARELLDEHAFSRHTEEERPPLMFGSVGLVDQTSPSLRWARERGLLIRRHAEFGPTRMPSEIALHLRGPDWRAPFTPRPPALELVPVTKAAAEREASATATSFVGMAAAVLSECAEVPPTRLKSGGLGARELTRIGKAVQTEQAGVRLVLECARACGLLSAHEGGYAVTKAYDTWTRQNPADQLVALLRAWWPLPRTPSLSHDEDGKALPALERVPPRDGSAQARQGLLAAAAGLPRGHGASDPADLGTHLAWHRPLADEPPQDPTPFASVIREAETLGVLARGALSPLGEALRTAPDELDEQAARLLPGTTRTARVGADLTAVVPGIPDARLTALLDLTADREVRSSASVWRFSPSSVRRALDAGHTAESLTTELTTACTGTLPQALTYLLADTARRHGHVRLAPASCVLHSADTTLVSEIAAHRALAKLTLRRLAPTVLLSAAPLDTVLRALREAGYAPVAESADGAARVERPERHRAAPVPHPRKGRPRKGPRPGHATPPDASTLAGKLLAAPPSPMEGRPYATDTEEIVDGCADSLSLADARQLAHAIDHDGAVTIQYTAASGNVTIRTLTRLELDPPYLFAWCHLRDDERVFALSRVESVMPA